jgi:hypothetical protein
MQQTFLTDALGYVAAGLVFATFCAQRMAFLRAIAIASNVAFIGYGFLDGLWPILILHSAMLPVNIRRYRQLVRGCCGTTTADAGTPEPSRSTLPRNLITKMSRNQGVSENIASAQTGSLDPFYIKGITRRQEGKSCIPIVCTTSSML